MNESASELVQTGLQQLDAQDFKTAETTLRQAADSGDAMACTILAREYRHRFHFAVTDDDDLRYTRLAAEKGSLFDRCLMAFYTASGQESRIKKNRIEAEVWLKPVQDHPAAQGIGKLFGLLG